MLASYEEIIKEKEISFSSQNSLLYSLHQRRFLWTLVTVIHMTSLQFQRTCLLLKLSFVCQIPNFCKLLTSKNMFVSCSKQISGTNFPVVILRLWENVSTNFAGLGTNCDVARGWLYFKCEAKV
jgi:hypothetical protein